MDEIYRELVSKIEKVRETYSRAVEIGDRERASELMEEYFSLNSSAQEHIEDRIKELDKKMDDTRDPNSRLSLYKAKKELERILKKGSRCLTRIVYRGLGS